MPSTFFVLTYWVHLRLARQPKLTALASVSEGWQARRESNPQPPVLETGALPIELLAYPLITVVIRDWGLGMR